MADRSNEIHGSEDAGFFGEMNGFCWMPLTGEPAMAAINNTR